MMGRPKGSTVDLTDIDDIAVERALRGGEGEPVRLRTADRVAAVRALTDRGHDQPDIAVHLACSLRTVVRDVALIRRDSR